MAELEPVDHDPWASPFDVPDGLVRIPPQMNVPAQQQWGAQKGTDILGSLTGVTDAARAARGEMSPEEQKNFALTAMAGMLPMGRALKPVAKAAEEIVPPGIRAYHGSPHDFERFDLSKIGTGEGAQAYGHGLYFAENPGVAGEYKARLSAPSVGNYQFRPLADELPTSYKPKDYPHGISAVGPDGNRYYLTSEGKWSADKTDAKQFSTSQQTEARNLASSARKELPGANPGKMYEVSIGADPEHFLHWDKPLSEQSPKVKEALRQLGIGEPHPQYVQKAENDLQTAWGKYQEARQAYGPKDERTGNAEMDWMTAQSNLERLQKHFRTTGEELYRSVPRLNREDATKTLREAGIPGIKYLDQGSRTFSTERIKDIEAQLGKWRRVPEGDPHYALAQSKIAPLEKQLADYNANQTHNYVVFDDKLIDIVKKYGIAGLVGTGASHFALQPVDHNPFEEKP